MRTRGRDAGFEEMLADEIEALIAQVRRARS